MKWSPTILLMLVIILPSCATATFQGDMEMVLSKSSASGLSKFFGLSSEYCKLVVKDKNPERSLTEAETELLSGYCPGSEDRLILKTLERQLAL